MTESSGGEERIGSRGEGEIINSREGAEHRQQI
jgi:hypothetical protein